LSSTRPRASGLSHVYVGNVRDRVRATAALLSVGATCHVYLQQVDDPDKLRAVVLEIASDLIH